MEGTQMVTGSAALSSTTAQRMVPSLFPGRQAPTGQQIRSGIQACLQVQRLARSFGKRPFAAVLIGPDNETVLLTHQSVDQVNHAESCLARLAYCHYSKGFLWQCTLFSTWEPCGMCSSTIYWAHIGRIVFAASNEQLAVLTGPGNKDNFTMKWSCKEILAGQQKDVEVIGPLEEDGLDQMVVRESDEYWSAHRDA
ncbi:MAG: hypothetical protein M1818_002714 [Claussenomyces sp. TS43310]|nr:MAG: hypothetical protein M1818_002714 [Claussenomyces sp. TS43310]